MSDQNQYGNHYDNLMGANDPPPMRASSELPVQQTTEAQLNNLSKATKPLAHEVDLERFNDLVQRCVSEREAKEAELEQIAGEARALQARYDAAKAEAKALVMRERALRAGIRTMEDFGLQHHGV